MHTIIRFKSMVGPMQQLLLHANLFQLVTRQKMCVVHIVDIGLKGEGSVLMLQSILHQAYYSVSLEIRRQYQFRVNSNSLTFSFKTTPLEQLAYDEAEISSCFPSEIYTNQL